MLGLSRISSSVMVTQKPQVEVIRAGVLQQSLSLTQSYLTIGRAPDNALCLSDDLSVSRYHAQIAVTSNEYVITDVGSSDGTYLNGQRLSPQVPHRLSNGDVVTMGTEFELKFVAPEVDVQPAANVVPQPQYKTVLGADVGFRDLPANQPAQELNLQGKSEFRFGRDPNNDLVIDHPSVSRHHSQVRFENGSYTIFDLTSTNGTYVNDQPCPQDDRMPIQSGDRICLGRENKVCFIFRIG